MFNSFTGTVTILTDSLCTVEVGGVEYALSISSSAARAFKSGTVQRVIAHLHHKDDQMKLYGFINTEERELFLQLLKVSGVGPSLAMKILSGLDTVNLKSAIDQGDVNSLSLIPGLGKKTAQKIILALQGSIVSAGNTASGPFGDVVDALVEMGFDKASARETVNSIARELPADLTAAQKEEKILRESIVILSRQGG